MSKVYITYGVNEEFIELCYQGDGTGEGTQ